MKKVATSHEPLYTKISDYDRAAMLEAIVDQTAGRVPVFVGPAAMSMKNTRENIKQAVRLEAIC